jgi:hypothetical protein
MRIAKSPDKSVRQCQKAVSPVGSRIARRGKRAANRGHRNDGSKSTIPNPPKIPPCNCGSTDFALVGSDGAMEYVALQCESCRKDYVFRLRGRKLTMLRQID